MAKSKLNEGNRVKWYGITGTVVEQLSDATWLVQLDNENVSEPIPIYTSELVKIDDD